MHESSYTSVSSHCTHNLSYPSRGITGCRYEAISIWNWAFNKFMTNAVFFYCIVCLGLCRGFLFHNESLLFFKLRREGFIQLNKNHKPHGFMCTNIMPAFIFLKDECSEFIVKSSVFLLWKSHWYFFIFRISLPLCNYICLFQWKLNW